MIVKWLICIAVFLGVLQNCKGTEDPSIEGRRIITLSPSITATVVDLGLEKEIVGRSPFCRAVNKTVPVVGEMYEIDYERLLRLQPTHVLVQETARGIDEHLSELAQRGEFILQSWHIDRFVDIQQLHLELMHLFDLEGEVLQVSLANETELPSPILIMTPGSQNAAGLCFGQETYLHDLLEMMGGVNALQKKGWISLSFEDIDKLHPAVIIVVSDSPQITVPRGINSLNIPVILFTHEDVLIPSSKIVDVAHALQQELSSK